MLACRLASLRLRAAFFISTKPHHLGPRYATPKEKKRPVDVKETTPSDAKVQTYNQNQNIIKYHDQPQTAESYYAKYEGATASQLVNQSASLQAFFKRTLYITAAAIGFSAGTTASHPLGCFGVGLLGSIASCLTVSWHPATYTQENGIIKAIHSPTRVALFGTFLAFEGLVLVPLLTTAAMYAPMAIPAALVLTTTTMAGMVAYALKQPQGEFAIKWGQALYVTAFGVVGMSILNMYMQSSFLSCGISFAVVGLFAAVTAHDTQILIDMHKEGEPDDIGFAADYFINFVDMFKHYLRLLFHLFD